MGLILSIPIPSMENIKPFAKIVANSNSRRNTTRTSIERRESTQKKELSNRFVSSHGKRKGEMGTRKEKNKGTLSGRWANEDIFSSMRLSNAGDDRNSRILSSAHIEKQIRNMIECARKTKQGMKENKSTQTQLHTQNKHGIKYRNNTESEQNFGHTNICTRYKLRQLGF